MRFSDLRPLRGLLTTALCCIPLGLAVGQRPPPSLDPAATVDSFWQAVLGMRWAEAVRYLDLTELERARQTQLESARLRPGREYTAVDLMRRDPDMPLEAAEYEIRRRDKLRRDYPQQPFPNYYGVDSLPQLERMPIEEVAMRWLQAHDPLWRLLEQLRTRRCPPSAGADSLLAGRRAAIYGAVRVGADTAYVVFKANWLPWPEPSGDMLEVATPRLAILRRDSSGWRIQAVEELLRGTGGLYGVANCSFK